MKWDDLNEGQSSDFLKACYEDLWEDFLMLGARFQERLTVPQFIFIMSQFVGKMAFDCAPAAEDANNLSGEGLRLGREWSLKEND
ncbi:hypothetical protein HC928_02465 [bacterium]|nr:hypothetical protein [bacterium]